MLGRLLWLVAVALLVALLIYVLTPDDGCPSGQIVAEDRSCVPADYWAG